MNKVKVKSHTRKRRKPKSPSGERRSIRKAIFLTKSTAVLLEAYTNRTGKHASDIVENYLTERKEQ